ncbi:MAG: hypothetical protein QM664_01255 [Flavihumibacter sp.]
MIEAPGDDFPDRIERWMSAAAPGSRAYRQNIPELLQYLMETYPLQAVELDELYPESQLC